MNRIFYMLSAAVFVVWILSGCNTKKQESKQEPEPVEIKASGTKGSSVSMPVSGSYDGDTINLHGKFVLFFGPVTGNEADGPEVLEFQNMSTRILDSLSRNPEIFSAYTSVNHIRIFNKGTGMPMIILRSSFSEPTGMIISDGLQSPIIKKGQVTEEEYRKLISQLFTAPS